ncbi:hypothetical protein [Synechococcus sp. CS-1332]|uniref:hypothetical protein n=1 Tax=Synechococcus sp. CS-1332 TaxID=2847972 RepID=UPI00223AF85A|nr:hypothetical protein [Synechococcus sp. CS-1332]MCT0206429.1 hypothetical protein [Synechococcus sp. CS-1332]
MPADAYKFQAALQANHSILTPEDRNAILDFSSKLDPDISNEELTSKLSEFLTHHAAINSTLFPVSSSPATDTETRLGGVRPRLNPQDFKASIRNIVLDSQRASDKNGEPKPTR